nr:MAG TPA: hypothetical protein [Caudoviricetes sp.]
MTGKRYTTSGRPRGGPYARRQRARLAERGAHRWVFAYNMAPDVETLVRRWLTARLDGFYCDLRAAYTPRVVGSTAARTHIVLNDAPPLRAMARADEAVEVDAGGSTPSDVAKALIEATGLNPRMTVCGWPFCSDDAEGGEA